MIITKVRMNGKHDDAVYPIETIKEIEHGKYRDFYDKDDIAGNDVRPNDSVIILRFKDGTTASFGSTWILTFE